MKTYETSGTYGGSQTPCTIFVCEDDLGGKWYCVNDSCNVNATFGDIDTGCDVEMIEDFDSFTLSERCESLSEFVELIEEHLSDDEELTEVNFKLNIESGNDAFQEDSAAEVIRILERVIDDIKNQMFKGVLRDINGNTVGSFELDIK